MSPITPTFQAFIKLLGGTAAIALAGTAAQAVPVSVSVEGLPPGLTVRADVLRNVCGDSLGWASNPSVPLSEASSVVYDQVTSTSGTTTLRPRLVTRYQASFDTPGTPVQGTAVWDKSCWARGMDLDRFRFGVTVVGQDAFGASAGASGPIGETLQTAGASVDAKVAARTSSLVADSSVLTRNVPHQVHMGSRSSIGAVQSHRLDLLRPKADGSLVYVASVLVDATGRRCVQTGLSLQCGTSGPVELGGVRLNDVKSGLLPSQVRFEFVLLSSIAPGALKVRASADAVDLARYLVDGYARALDLLPWQAMELDLWVQ